MTTTGDRFHPPYMARRDPEGHEVAVVDKLEHIVCKVAVPPGNYGSIEQASRAQRELAEKIARLLNDATVWESIRPVV